jgi:predicted acylesterase/phospholipase RssA
MRKLKLGLALGAGGTRGAAHVGAMCALADEGITPDVIAGTSIGSLYGGLVAVGHSPHEIEEGIRACPERDVYALFRDRLKLRANNRLARLFYSELAPYHIEDLAIPYAATASDIAERRSVAITTGPMIDAIEASIAIPLIARPVLHQGRYLLDGGFWDSAPVDAAHELGADVIIAIQIARPYQLNERLRSAATRAVSVLDRVSLQRTLAGVPFTIRAVSTPLQQGRSAQLILRPMMPAFRGNSPSRQVDCLEAGILAAKEALPAIKALLAGEAPAAVAAEYAPKQPLLLPDPGLA